MRTAPLLVVVLAATLVACGDEPGEPRGVAPVHEHRAPHGGALQVPGDEAAHLELVFDPATGRLTGYVLDGEAENAVRVNRSALRLRIGGEDVELRAVAAP